ncbi:hypothetical protein HGRIS_007473 [Hohenbuehelia grisea]|uniref:DUF7702 domain-containing protein n=1 Tax=Hohenbuehelia grisea TaxID=104357 RepID=A0ABR3J5P5_9AGAR
MPTLPERGKIAAAEIAFYIPIALVTIVLVARYAFRRDAGWLFLFVYSLIRITNGALLVAAYEVSPPNLELFRAAVALDIAALAFLILATIGFLGLVGQYAFSESNRTIRIFRVIGLLALAALAISVAGAVQSNDPQNDGARHTGTILRRVGAVLYAVLWVVLFLTHIVCYSYRHHVLPERRTLLRGITLALLLIGVRVAYAIMNAWSAADELGFEPSANATLRRFNINTGEWQMWLILDLVMEYAATLVYLLSSTLIPLRKDGTM